MIVPDSTEIKFDKDEVDSVVWFMVSDLDKDIKEHPELFTADFIAEWELLRDKLI